MPIDNIKQHLPRKGYRPHKTSERQTQKGKTSELRTMRDEVFEQVAALALAQDRSKAQLLIRRLQALDDAIATASPEPDTSKYGKYKQARGAILDCLDEIGHAVDQEVIVEDLTSNGFRRGKKDADKDVRKSIGFHCGNYRGVEAKVIKRVGGLVGRWEWDKSKFVR